MNESDEDLLRRVANLLLEAAPTLYGPDAARLRKLAEKMENDKQGDVLSRE